MVNQQSLMSRRTVPQQARPPLSQLIGMALLLLLSADAHAATFTVTTQGDRDRDGHADHCPPNSTAALPIQCSLRDAIAASNRTIPERSTIWNTIYLRKGNYVLKSELPAITVSLIVRGDGPDGPAATVIWGPCTSVTRQPISGHCDPFPSTEFRIFDIATASNVALSEMTIRGGHGPDGAGIHNSGILSLSHVTVMGNTAHQGAGGIWNDGGDLLLLNSTVRDNFSHHGPGGGIVNGRIFQGDATNPATTTASISARGHHVDQRVSKLRIVSSTISGNQDGGNADGNLRYDGYGGGITNSGWLYLEDSTISGNLVLSSDSQFAAGGILNLGQVGPGKGVLVTHLGEALLRNVTITQNEGGMGSQWWSPRATAVRNAGGVQDVIGNFQFANTIIAGNNLQYGGSDCFGNLITLRGNLVGKLSSLWGGLCRLYDAVAGKYVSTTWWIGDKPVDQIGKAEDYPMHWNIFVAPGKPGDAQNTGNPKLDNNGGLTCTHALCRTGTCFDNPTGSLALNKGSAFPLGCTVTDQRGITRNTCDSGAVTDSFSFYAPVRSDTMKCSGLGPTLD